MVKSVVFYYEAFCENCDWKIYTGMKTSRTSKLLKEARTHNKKEDHTVVVNSKRYYYRKKLYEKIKKGG